MKKFINIIYCFFFFLGYNQTKIKKRGVRGMSNKIITNYNLIKNTHNNIKVNSSNHSVSAQTLSTGWIVPDKPSVQSTAAYKVTLSNTSLQKASTSSKTHGSNTRNSGGILGIFSNIKKDISDTTKSIQNKVNNFVKSTVSNLNNTVKTVEHKISSVVKSTGEKLETVAKDIKEGLKKAVDVTTTNSISVVGNKTIKEKKITLNVAGNKMYLKFTSSVSGEVGVEKSSQYKANTEKASGFVEHSNSGKLNLELEKRKISKSFENSTSMKVNDKTEIVSNVTVNKRGAEIAGGTKLVLLKTHNQEVNVTVGGEVKSNRKAEINLAKVTHSLSTSKITSEQSIGLSIDEKTFNKIKTTMQGVWLAVPNDTKFKIGVAVGVIKGAVNTVKSLVDVVTHPKQIAEGARELIKHPQVALKYVEQSIAKAKEEFVNGDDYKRGEMVGEALFEVGVSIAGTKGLDKLAKAAKVSNNLGKLKKVFDVTTKVAKPAFGH